MVVDHRWQVVAVMDQAVPKQNVLVVDLSKSGRAGNVLLGLLVDHRPAAGISGQHVDIVSGEERFRLEVRDGEWCRGRRWLSGKEWGRLGNGDGGEGEAPTAPDLWTWLNQGCEGFWRPGLTRPSTTQRPAWWGSVLTGYKHRANIIGVKVSGDPDALPADGQTLGRQLWFFVDRYVAPPAGGAA